MLSRTADHLYWMSRYVERTENIARFMDVANRLSLSGGSAHEVWCPVLTITGGQDAYMARHGDVSALGVISWAILDHQNPSSLISCIRAARENTHAVRSVVPTEVWEAINGTWLEVKQLDGAKLRDQGLATFLDWVKERAQLTRGATMGSMLRDEPNEFLRMGGFLERADNTARLLGVRAQGVTAETRVVDVGLQLHWAAVLRSVSAYKAFRLSTREDVSPAGAAKVLIMNSDLPRSLKFCLQTVLNSLARLAPNAECTRLAGASHAKLHFGVIENLLEGGLDQFVFDFLGQNARLSNQIHTDFLMS